MSGKKAFVAVLIAVTLLLVAASAMANSGPLPATGSGPGWVTSNARLVSQGTFVRMNEGIMVNGYTIEADAVSVENPAFDRGTMTITLNLFRPRVDMPGQLAGHWYATGKWEIIDRDADPEALAYKHNPYKISGNIAMELPFNVSSVTRRSSTFSVPVTMLMTQTGGGRSFRIEATFSGSSLFDGTMAFGPDAVEMLSVLEGDK